MIHPSRRSQSHIRAQARRFALACFGVRDTTNAMKANPIPEGLSSRLLPTGWLRTPAGSFEFF